MSKQQLKEPSEYGSKWEDLWTNHDLSSSDHTSHCLFVSNLAPTVTARQLRKVFETIGRLISVSVTLNPKDGSSRCCGFVDYVSSHSREKARRSLHGHNLSGSNIRVSRSGDARTLYVGNLPRSLQDMEDDHDNQVISIASNKLFELTGIAVQSFKKRKHYNYGFADYQNHRQAHAALMSLRNTRWNGHELRVEIATSDPQKQQPQTDIHSHDSKQLQDEKRTTLYVRNLNKSTTDLAFRNMFETYGELRRCLIIKDVPKRRLNYGFVQYESCEAADEAYHKCNGKVLDDIVLQIEFSRTLPGERKKRMLNDMKSSVIHKPRAWPYGRWGASPLRSRSRSRDRHRHSRYPSPKRNRTRDVQNPICVNLPTAYSMNRDEHIIGFDTERRRYILFQVEKTSASLDRLESFHRRQKRDRERKQRRGRYRKIDRDRVASHSESSSPYNTSARSRSSQSNSIATSNSPIENDGKELEQENVTHKKFDFSP
eukprot:125113_1